MDITAQIIYLNTNSGAVQGVSTVILVLITAFYAWQTYRANRLIYRQVIPRIKLEIERLELRWPNGEQLKEITDGLKNDSNRSYNIHFTLTYKLINQSASFGTVEKPKLVLTSKKEWRSLGIIGKIGFILARKKNRKFVFSYSKKTRPFVSFGGSVTSSELLAAYQLSEMEGSLSNTIYLRPGETRNLEQKFSDLLFCKNPDQELLYFVQNITEVDYSISYINEKGRVKCLPVKKEKISSEK
ncbi:MAG: hypothetical protein WCQ96_02575 [Patescibacteria group bacterium]